MLKNSFYLLMALLLFSCGKDPLPKPSGELRLEYPKPAYQQWKSDCAYSFEFSKFAELSPAGSKPCWSYISYPKMKAKVIMTYLPIENNFKDQVMEAEKMVYKHNIRASAIDAKFFEYPEKKVYGMFYELKGQTASNIQFFVTDSTRHFVTGNLNFNSRPKPDSLAPAIDYVKKDLMHLIDTFEWKK